MGWAGGGACHSWHFLGSQLPACRSGSLPIAMHSSSVRDALWQLQLPWAKVTPEGFSSHSSIFPIAGLWSNLQVLCFSPQFGVTSTAPGLQSSFLPGLHLLLLSLMERHSIHGRCKSLGGLFLQIWLNVRSVPAGCLGKKNLQLHFSVKIYFY